MFPSGYQIPSDWQFFLKCRIFSQSNGQKVINNFWKKKVWKKTKLAFWMKLLLLYQAGKKLTWELDRNNSGVEHLRLFLLVWCKWIIELMRRIRILFIHSCSAEHSFVCFLHPATVCILFHLPYFARPASRKNELWKKFSFHLEHIAKHKLRVFWRFLHKFHQEVNSS